MDRRTFLVGLGRFAGATLALPTLPTIFDMGRLSTVALLPQIEVVSTLSELPSGYLPVTIYGHRLYMPYFT